MASETIGSLILVNRPCSKKLIAVSDVMIGPRGAGLDPENPHWVRGPTSLG